MDQRAERAWLGCSGGLASLVDCSSFAASWLRKTRSISLVLFCRKKCEGWFSRLLRKEVFMLSEGVSMRVIT